LRVGPRTCTAKGGAVVNSLLTGSGLTPNVVRTSSGMVPDAQACGLEAVGYSTGKSVSARS
jgi:hypothetical protein